MKKGLDSAKNIKFHSIPIVLIKKMQEYRLAQVLCETLIEK